MADKPAHGRHWQADIRSGLRCWLERPLSEAQLTKDRGWTGRVSRLARHKFLLKSCFECVQCNLVIGEEIELNATPNVLHACPLKSGKLQRSPHTTVRFQLEAVAANNNFAEA